MSMTGIKGMNDILPGEVETWQFLESAARRVFALHGFSEIRVPVVEKTELFRRSIGETTDIVEKEMYTFVDKGGTSLTLRPEGTASVMRAFIEHKLYAADPVAKLYYMGPMFRYERPQKGRYRQFHQIGVEAVGVDDPRIDAQILAMLCQFFDDIGLDELELQINSLGCPECRPAYRRQLVAFLEARLGELCDDCRRRVTSNPLRVLDCKAAGCREATVEAPAMLDHLCGGCDDHFAEVRTHLDAVGTPYAVNRRMVRGLDYYTRTTFEMVTANLGAQNAVAAGGRYDGLVRELGGPALPGIGFAMGVERLALLLGDKRQARQSPALFVAALGDAAQGRAFVLMHQMQRQGLRVEIDYQGRSLKSQMRRADKLAAPLVLIIGEDELARGVGQLRFMADSSQREVALVELYETVVAELAGWSGAGQCP
ncbi:histidine--tRNA ligase [Geoalkalibacter sp.]|uniref:histidine--tRNA ligase n=1 Tax=Geoalkalibacter sp. TaxID=3041440 RepID=UPI003FA531C2